MLCLGCRTRSKPTWILFRSNLICYSCDCILKALEGSGMKKAIAISVFAFCFCQLILSLSFTSHCKAQNGDGPSWCGTAWPCDTVSLTGKEDTGKFAGLALSLNGKWGFATDQPSSQAAQNLAGSKCAASNDNQDCAFLASTQTCFGVAQLSTGYLLSQKDEQTRIKAWTETLSDCNGDNCRLLLTACSGDDQRTAPPFPLPPNTTGGRSTRRQSGRGKHP